MKEFGTGWIMVNIVAEIGCNHMGDVKIAQDMVYKAFQCGVDYVKFQKRDVLGNMSSEKYQEPYNNSHSFGETYGEHRIALEIEMEEWSNISHNVELDFDKEMFATSFDAKSLVDCAMFEICKIGSAQLSDLDLLKRAVSAFGYDRRIILSTGMSTLEEIDKAFEIIKNNDPVLMQCTSVYPCPEEYVNLNVIPMLKKRYGCEVGLSGHYVSGSGAIEAAAVALGATWIERHFTLDRTWKGTDQAASLEPAGLTSVVKAIRSAEKALGSSEKKVLEIEEPVRRKHRACS